MYNIEDCVLIRKTGTFPKDGIVETPVHALAYEFGTSTIIGDAICDKLREKYTTNEDMTRESKKYDVYFETYRSTIHFTINGVVADSVYGQFSYPFAIIEPLKHHINDESLATLRVEDTYFTDDMKLSNEAIILVPESEVDSLKEKYDLEGITIRTYKDSLEEAIKETLTEKGYDFFDVNDHGYRKGLDSGTKDSEMYNFIYEYSKVHGIPQQRHFYAEINYEDREKRQEEAEKIDELHLRYILDSGLVSEETIDKVNKLFENRMYYKQNFEKLMSQVVDQVGLDKLAELTDEFNQKMINERESKLMVRNESKEKELTQTIDNRRLN